MLHKLRLMILAWLLYGKKIELVIDGTIVDIANVIRARTQKIRRVWFRELVENCVAYGDRGYRGCEGVIVCDSRDMRAKLHA